MTEQLINDLIVILESHTPGCEGAVRKMYALGALTDTTVKRTVVGCEFFRIFTSTRDRTARDIELEIAARYDIPLKTVQEIRRNAKRGGQRGKPGRKSK